MTADSGGSQKSPESGAARNGHTDPPPAAGMRLLFDQVFNRDSLSLLRAAVAAHAGQVLPTTDRLYDVIIAAHELAANAVRHGAGRGRLRLWADGRALRLEVSDEGRNPGTTGSFTGVKGHGLWLVGQVASEVRVQSGPAGTVATATFSINSTPWQPGPPGHLEPR